MKTSIPPEAFEIDHEENCAFKHSPAPINETPCGCYERALLGRSSACRMKVFVCHNFRHDLPYADAVIVAKDEDDAAHRLEIVLENQGWIQDRHWIPEFFILDLDRPSVLISNHKEATWQE